MLLDCLPTTHRRCRLCRGPCRCHSPCRGYHRLRWRLGHGRTYHGRRSMCRCNGLVRYLRMARCSLGGRRRVSDWDGIRFHTYLGADFAPYGLVGGREREGSTSFDTCDLPTKPKHNFYFRALSLFDFFFFSKPQHHTFSTYVLVLPGLYLLSFIFLQ